MAAARPGGNPYRPGRGTIPPLLAGRDSELALAEELLDRLGAGNPPPRDLLFYGPRGNGKTALLMEIAARARKRGLRVARLPVAAFAGEAGLDSAIRHLAGIASVRLTGVQVGPLGVTTERPARPVGVFQAFSEWITANPAPLVLVLDEVQKAPTEVGGAFFDAVQSAKSDCLPFLLVAAGTPDAPSRVRDMGTHNERGFSLIPVGRLDHDATAAALAEPAKASGFPMTDAAVARLSAASQHYPYFVQLFGSGAWDSASRTGAGGIGEEAARGGIAVVWAEVERFYGNRYDEARARGVHRFLLPLAQRFMEVGGNLRDRELERLLEEAVDQDADPGAWIVVLATLRDLGVLWETTPGLWEMGIPSFARHILEREAVGG